MFKKILIANREEAGGFVEMGINWLFIHVDEKALIADKQLVSCYYKYVLQKLQMHNTSQDMGFFLKIQIFKICQEHELNLLELK
jgi:hypothetical protein